MTKAHYELRPWWWWLNPWLYIKRRDIAYETALDIIEWQGRSIGQNITKSPPP